MTDNNKNFDIDMLVMDVDGVLTDGGLIVHADGSESKQFHVHDGAWIRIWRRLGKKTAVITGRTCAAVEQRMTDLEIDYLYQGSIVKLDEFNKLLDASRVPAEKMAYIGDDVFDMPVLRRVGFAVSVADALEDVRDISDHVTNAAGGRGAVGELIRYLIKQMDLWDMAMERYRR